MSKPSKREVPLPEFLELESDPTAISHFVTRENANTESSLIDIDFHRDVEAIMQIIGDTSNLHAITRRGAWLYTFRQTGTNPFGIWQRLSEDEVTKGHADWETVFDLDTFCSEADANWHWRGAVTAWFDPDLVLLCLSLEGSDLCRHIEFDCCDKAIVRGGFDLPPDRLTVTWLDADTLLCATANEGAATSSGWAGQVRRLVRGSSLTDAPIVFEADRSDLLVSPYIVLRADNDPLVCISRYFKLGKEQVIILGDEGSQQILPSPPDTTVCHSATHYAYIVQQEGGEPGALLLGEIGKHLIRTVFQPEERRSIVAGSILILRDWMLWIESDNLRPKLQALDLHAVEVGPVTIQLPEPAETFWIKYHDTIGSAGDETLQLTLTGFLRSPSTYVFNLAKGPDGIAWQKLREEPESFDPSGMEVKLLEATSEDGTAIPYHLVLPKQSVQRTESMPVLIYGYGGYGHTVTPWYDRINGTLWLARGGAYALAHIRGGGEFGPNWHLQAKGSGRTKSFQDFAAIARDLEDRSISRADRIACHGHSNGGLLCGVMLTRYPEHFGVVWASAGGFDMTRFHRFQAGRAWMDEYGDPEDPVALAWLTDYSPMHNIPDARVQSLPSCLIDTHTHDDRVDPSHARRMVAVLRLRGHDPWFYEHRHGGHTGGGAMRSLAREQALGYAFLRQALDLHA